MRSTWAVRYYRGGKNLKRWMGWWWEDSHKWVWLWTRRLRLYKESSCFYDSPISQVPWGMGNLFMENRKSVNRTREKETAATKFLLLLLFLLLPLFFLFFSSSYSTSAFWSITINCLWNQNLLHKQYTSMQESTNCSCKEPDSEYFQLPRTLGVCLSSLL